MTRYSAVQYWHAHYTEPCEHGPATPNDEYCAAHGLPTVRAGHNGWPTDLNNLGHLAMRAYNDTSWFDVTEVLAWSPIRDAGRHSRHKVEYTVVIDNGGHQQTITTDTVAFIAAAQPAAR